MAIDEHSRVDVFVPVPARLRSARGELDETKRLPYSDEAGVARLCASCRAPSIPA